jgi:hypothetical protein
MKKILFVMTGLLCLAVAAGTADAATKKRKASKAHKETASEAPAPAGPPQIEQATITGGRLVISGRTTGPNQVVTLVGPGDKTASDNSRRFRFDLSYLPETCKVSLQVESATLNDYIVSSCAPRGKDGADGKPGQDGKSAEAGFSYGSLGGDGTTFKCWLSDVVGLWFIKDYPTPNARTIAHIVPDGFARSNKVNLTEPDNPLKTEQPDGPGVTQWAEFDGSTLYVLNRTTKNRLGMRGDISPDCRSIVWRGAGDGNTRRWER